MPSSGVRVSDDTRSGEVYAMTSEGTLTNYIFIKIRVQFIFDNLTDGLYFFGPIGQHILGVASTVDSALR